MVWSIDAKHIETIARLIETQYEMNEKTKPDAYLADLIQRLNKIQEAENTLAGKEKRKATNYLSSLQDPLFFMKILRANYAKRIAHLKDEILDFPEDRVTKAFTDADAKFKELQPAFQALKSAFMKIKLTPNETQNQWNTAVPIVNQFHVMPTFYPVPQAPTDTVRIQAQGITFTEGIIVIEAKGKPTFVPLLLKPCKAEDIFRWSSNGLFLKTASGTGNSSYKSDPISVNDLTDITLKYRVFLEPDKGGVGFGFQSEGKWIVQKSYSYTEGNEGVVEGEIKLPPAIKEDITLVISNSRAKAERSRILFDLLELTAKRKKK